MPVTSSGDSSNQTRRTRPALLVIAGPAGVGKSTVCGLLAERFERTVRLSADDVAGFIIHGFVDQWRPEAAHQNEVLGGVLAVAAMTFVEGGYTVLLDGHIFPDGFDGLADACAARRLPAHYAVLRTDVQTCLERATARGPLPEEQPFVDLHARYEDLGTYEPNVIDAARPPDAVASDVHSALASGELSARSASERDRFQ